MKKIPCFFPVFLSIFCLCFIYSVSVQRNLSSNLLRLHVVANSNSPIDQRIKLGVRDRILEKSEKDFPEIAEMEVAAQEYLDTIGAPYHAEVAWEKCHIPAKAYKQITLPQGEYNCVKVTLGNGLGENWWCVAYPPLCYTESMFGAMTDEGKEKLYSVLDNEAVLTIAQNGKFNVRFKIVETIQSIIAKIHY